MGKRDAKGSRFRMQDSLWHVLPPRMPIASITTRKRQKRQRETLAPCGIPLIYVSLGLIKQTHTDRWVCSLPGKLSSCDIWWKNAPPSLCYAARLVLRQNGISISAAFNREQQAANGEGMGGLLGWPFRAERVQGIRELPVGPTSAGNGRIGYKWCLVAGWWQGGGIVSAPSCWH